MVGIDLGDHVMVYASTELTQAELEYVTHHERDPLAATPFATSIPRVRTIVLHVGMKSYVTCEGTTWAEAFARLFDFWTPDAPEPAGLAALDAAAAATGGRRVTDDPPMLPSPPITPHGPTSALDV